MSSLGRTVTPGNGLPALVLVAALGAGCRYDLEAVPRPGGDGAGGASGDGAADRDGSQNADAPVDGGGDRGPDAPVCPSMPPAVRTAIGGKCACGVECASAICADGICCRTLCGTPCKACNVPGSKGTCTLVPGGLPPARPGECKDEGAAGCGLDGMCDGRGGCELYPSGSLCLAGKCDGAAVISAKVCDGKGACKDGPTVTCAPFGCNAGGTPHRCFGACGSDADCAPGRKCVAGSCGKKFNGAECTAGTECASGSCADGVCCGSACGASCVSCKLLGAVGDCQPVPKGHPDPHGGCKEADPTTCGAIGVCDGAGQCARYPAGSACGPAACMGTLLRTASACDASGKCVGGATIDCAPFTCRDGGCLGSCTSKDDCAPGRDCLMGSCGKKGPGQTCAAPAECASGFCADGVCCKEACAGACRTCAGMTPGDCIKTAAGVADPRAVCKNTGAASCQDDGTCDGAGACRRYAVGTVCAAASCTGSTRVEVSKCDAANKCVPGAMTSCAPFKCNGAACFTSCTADDNCVAPAKCVMGSCGKKPLGAACTDPVDCLSGFCAQGVCCNQACIASCTACNLTGSAGTCINVPTGGSDPTGTCKDGGVAACGNDGTCNGAGGCHRYMSGAVCKPASCPAGTSTRTQESTCDGAGACKPGGTQTCAPFLCDAATSACKTTCSGDGDCVTGNACIAGSCGKKPVGSMCGAGGECVTGFCSQGVCCNIDCSGGCRACNLPGAVGMCTNIGAGMPAVSGCTDAGPAACGFNGKCDGAGACQKYVAGTVCVSASCPAGSSTRNLARTCDGAGTCSPGSTQSCAPYMCNGVTDCLIMCSGSGDCTAGNVCSMGSCGKKGTGASCTADSECTSGFCRQGVCCTGDCSALCKSCALSTSLGTCSFVPAGAAPPAGGCADSPPCGDNGKCNGTGGCQKYAMGTECAPQSCPMGSSTLTYAKTCNGTGSCVSNGTAMCNPYMCDGAASCLMSCGSPGDCVPPTTCTPMGTCGTLGGLGASCASPGECASGSCVDMVCCGSSSCPACQTCAPGGSCTAVSDGVACAGGQCRGGACCTGCWNGSVCKAGDTIANCGTGGIDCTGCTVCHACSSGSCAPSTGGACRDCGTCSSGSCVGTGGVCPTCQACDGSGTCAPSMEGAYCGGGTCTDICSGTRSTCTSGTCMPMAITCTCTPVCAGKVIREQQCTGSGATAGCTLVTIESCGSGEFCGDCGGSPCCCSATCL